MTISHTYPAGDNNAGDDRHKSGVGEPGLPLERHKVREHRREERRRRSDGLVERHGEVSERHISSDDGGAEDEAEDGDLEQLRPRPDGLERRDSDDGDGEVAERRAGRHVAHCQEDRESEAVIREEEFVEKKDSDVRGVPQNHQRGYEDAGGGRRRRRVKRKARHCDLPSFGFGLQWRIVVWLLSVFVFIYFVLRGFIVCCVSERVIWCVMYM